VTRVNGFEQHAFIVLMKWCLKPEVDSNNALAPYLISPENVNLRACENIRGIRTRHITTTLDAEHNTTTTSVQGNHTQRSVLPRCALRSALYGWLMRVRWAQRMRDDWVREDAFDNRGVEYDPIGQFRGVGHHTHAFSTRPRFASCIVFISGMRACG
jgi:hypothetical protein